MSSPYRIQGKKAICFDVNQTLISQGAHFEQAFRAVWNDYSARWSQDEGFPLADEVWSAYQTQWQQQKKLKNVRQKLDDLQQECLKNAIRQLEVPVHQQFAYDFFQSIRKLRLAAKSLAPGVQDMLSELSPRFMLAVISNSPRSEVLHLLDRFDLRSYFPEQRIFTAQKQTDKKPETQLFKTAIRTLGLTPRQVIMVGNSWKHDVCGAVKAGMDAVWVQRQTDATAKKISQQKLGRRNVFCIQHMTELMELFT
jgi:putative hydrolase of the HAD superfamily